jgi:flagellar hook-basal body complex protein FliE
MLPPIASTTGPEWLIGGLDGELQVPNGPAEPVPGTDGAQGGSFGNLLQRQISSLDEVQNDAAKQSLAVANGTAEDPTAAVMAIERARLAMQLASQIRTKGIEAVNDVFHTAV